MLISCTNKGCYTQDEHLLDEETGEVICMECGDPINLPQTTKKTLATLHQVKKHTKKALEFTCKSCDAVGRPVLKTAGKTTIAVCKACDKPLQISSFFVEALKIAKSEESTDEPAANRARPPAKMGKKPGANKDTGSTDKVPSLQSEPRARGTGLPKKQAKVRK